MLKARQDEAARLRRAHSDEPHSPWDINDAFEFTPPREITYAIEADGALREVKAVWTSSGPHIAAEDAQKNVEIIPTDDGVIAWAGMRQSHIRFAQAQRSSDKSADGGSLRAPMPGRLTKIFVKEGDSVKRGDRLAIVEAMKMEHVLNAPADGVVKALSYSEGQQVDSGAVIAEVETDGQDASD